MCDPQLFRSLATPFVRGLADKAQAIKVSDLTKHQRARLRESMTVDIRKLGDLCVPDARCPMLSEQAARTAEERGIDLREQTWQTQTKFDPGRLIFHYEHYVPVTNIVTAVLRCSGSMEVLNTLHERLQVAWILKTEDRELTRLGYKQHRDDPAGAYAEAAISLVASHPITPEKFASSDGVAPPPNLMDLVWWTEQALQEEINESRQHHELDCSVTSDSHLCSCELPRRRVEEVTARMRLVSRLIKHDDPVALSIACQLFAFPHRHRAGYQAAWRP
ncbi:hypothetical protein ENKNEFLB_03598 [Nocardioides aquaticus]|uniref:DUF222 domain-containing protein n=3 Tax=Actinomycetes TaxID=1760 RepID=A0ABX8EMP9_9ACTN|nr:hypothetical protein [Nocardioides aquaticus]QVT81190.1 hypothetical protein ENKNEFLB_03598 [Nocardioides aquaticus]